MENLARHGGSTSQSLLLSSNAQPLTIVPPNGKPAQIWRLRGPELKDARLIYKQPLLQHDSTSVQRFGHLATTLGAAGVSEKAG